jgi:predicted transposase/invertase (TIGR01784 family)
MSKLETNYPEGSEVIMTLAERFRNEGMEKGIAKGIEKGIEEGMAKVVRKSIIKGLTTEDIIEITGLKKEEIDEIRKKMIE